MFQTFKTQAERARHGGTAFLELQYCKLPKGTSADKILSTDYITFWQNDSLYVSADDIYESTYFSPALTDTIIERLYKKRPVDYEILIQWLAAAKKNNGFYILGL